VFLLSIASGLAAEKPPAVFQYRIDIEVTQRDKTLKKQAFLWIPPEADQVRGAIVCGMTLMEQHFVKDPQIRRACKDEKLAIIFMRCSLRQADIQALLDTFAALSGYKELCTAPMIFVGHSAGGPPALAHAAAMPERCIALIQYRGGMPSVNKPIDPGIPSLAMLGQFDEFHGRMRTEDGVESWERALDTLRAYRKRHPTSLASAIVEPGAGHFAWSDRNAAYLSQYIRKASRARIPPAGNADAERAIVLKRIEYESGWLCSFDLKKREPGSPVPDYGGDPVGAMWCFDEELAGATHAYHSGITGREDQFLKWEDRYWVDAGARFFFTQPTWVGDGQTLRVHPAYSDKVPGRYNGRGPIWPTAGRPVGHSSIPIKVKPVGGPLIATGPDTVRVQFDALSPADEPGRSTFMAYSAGDDQYRYTEHVGMMPRGFKTFNKGKNQTITFPELKDISVGQNTVELKAVSDAGLPVDYYVAYGPAIVDGRTLRITEIPGRAKYPIEVSIVAYQFGRGKEPFVKTAVHVERRFRIVNVSE
jgi:hypothetical protein